MYVTINPNQAVAMSQGYQSGATAFPIGVKSSLHGNTVTYSFNPTLASAINSQAMAFNPTYATSTINPYASIAFNQNLSSGINPTIASTIANQALANQALASQAWANQAWSNNAFASQAFNSAINSGLVNMNAIASSTGLAQMRVDLAETNSDVVVAAELPNVSLNDLIVTVTDDSMSISATAWAGSSATSLYRTIALPTTIKSEQCEATYANGVLELRAPKSDVVTRRKVKVNLAQ
ncbi:MAG: Hsp20/alpha crystallin family protein [Acidobacteriota bacterium]